MAVTVVLFGLGWFAGVLGNGPESMIRWLREPQAVLPGDGMPDQGIRAGEARDIAAFLYQPGAQ